MAYTLHGRAEWLRYSSHGMSGPSQDKRAVRQIVIHYNGGNADLDGPDDIYQDEVYARVLARMNDQYWNDPNRRYALGYNWGCGPDGDLWEIRGLDIRCGANGCQLVNVPATAIQVTTRAVTAPPTDAQIAALKNQWVPWLRTQYPNALVIVGHRDVRSKCSDGGATACPGPQLYPLVQQGYFNEPDGQAEEEPVTPAEIEAIATQAAEKVWATLIDNVSDPTKPDVPARSALAYTLRNTAATYLGTAPGDESVQGQLTAIANEVAELRQLIEDAGSPDAAAIQAAVRTELDRTVLGPSQ
jgi:hypothetical protein